MPRIKNDLANHLAASMDARMVKTARLLTHEDIGYDPKDEAPTTSLDEEGMSGEICPMTGKPIWECDCPECMKKKMMMSEEGTNEPAEGLSVEEELMRLESLRNQMRKTAIKEPEDEHWKIRSELLQKLNELKMKHNELVDKLNDPELVKNRETFQEMFPDWPHIPEETKSKAYSNPRLLMSIKSAFRKLMAPSLMLAGDAQMIQDEMDDLEKQLRELDESFSKGESAPEEKAAPVEVKVPKTVRAPMGDPVLLEGLPRPAWGPMVGQAQKAILALTKISETLDKAGLVKSAYATLRTAQVLQKEIK